MIKVKNLTKEFDGFKALENVSFSIERGSIYGLVGANGAGKSTLLRVLSGVYAPEAGTVEIEGSPVYDNVEVKAKIVFVPDELYFLRGASLKRMEKLYKSVFSSFDSAYFDTLIETFKLDAKKPIQSFSKGLKRQAAILLALACRPQYLFLDETFDGLDPVVRNLVKSVVCREVEERQMTVVLSSHSLRELEGICDQLALLYEGGLVFESDVVNIKTSMFKVQVAYTYDYDREIFDGLDILQYERKGTVSNLIVRGDREETIERLREMDPAILEVVPMSLEEVFTYELGAMGYTFDAENLEKEEPRNEN